jgi:drug/metabolite transporter (DMT)-like permease
VEAKAQSAASTGLWERLPADPLLFVAVSVWGLNFAVSKYALEHGFDPLAWMPVRFAIATALFSAVTFGFERPIRPGRRALVIMVGAGATVLLANQLCFVFALDLSTAATIALVFGTMPISASLLERRSHGRRHWAAATVSCAGVALVALGAGAELSTDVLGIVLGVATPLTWVIYSVVLQPHVAGTSTARVNAVSAIGCLVPFLAVSSPSLAGQDWGEVTGLAWACLGFSAVVSYFGSNLVWFHMINRVGTARAALYANLQPFLGTLFAVALLSEHLTAIQVGGGAIIAAGILLSRWRAPLVPPPD